MILIDLPGFLKRGRKDCISTSFLKYLNVMPINQKGYTLPVLGIILLVLIAVTGTYAAVSSQNQWDKEELASVNSGQPDSAAPGSSEKLIPFPELKKASEMPQVEFKDQDFPFSFSYPEYFEKTIPDVEIRKLETLKENPDYVWRLLAQARIGVPDSSIYDYSNCENKLVILISKYANIENTNLLNFIKIIRDEYPGGGRTESFATYEKGLSKIDYPRPNSYMFTGVISENPVKEVFFEYGDAFYDFYLIGGCDTGGSYSKDGEAFFENILKNLKFK